MKAQIVIKNGVLIIIPDNHEDMDKFFNVLYDRPDNATQNCRIACYDGYENALEVSLWNNP